MMKTEIFLLMVSSGDSPPAWNPLLFNIFSRICVRLFHRKLYKTISFWGPLTLESLFPCRFFRICLSDGQ